MKYIKANPGKSIALANLILVVLIFFLYDPFKLYSGGYSSADSILESDISEIDSIQIQNESFSRSVRIRRGQKLSIKNTPGQSTEKENESELKRSIEAYVNSYEWQYESADSTWKTADSKRVAELLFALKKARKYYSFEASAENLSQFEMGKTESGKSMAVSVTVNTGDQKTHFEIGRAPSYSQSYVRIDSDSELYLVEQNLRVPAGSADPEYFRNRDVFPADLTAAAVTAVNAYFENQTAPLKLIQAGSDWQMVSPSAGKVNSVEWKAILDHLVELRVTGFLDSLPAGLDRSYKARFEILYNKTMAEPVVASFDVIGQKGYSDYVIEYEGNLYEITSIYLEDLYAAEKKLLEKGL